MSSPNEMRKYMAVMRGEKPHETTKKDLSMRDLLAITRNLNENTSINQATDIDQKEEEKKMNDFFSDLNVTINYEPLEVYHDKVFFAGVIDGQLAFAFRVTPEEKTSGPDYEATDSFEMNDPDNEKVVKKLEAYYDDFYKYWRDNEFLTDENE
jgi:hypothetical protein